MINDSYFINFPELETDRLSLRKLQLTDAQAIQFIRSNNEVMRFMDSDHQNTIEDSLRFISSGEEVFNKKEGLFWAVINKDSKEFMGDFSFWRIDRKNARAEIGYTLKPQFWGKGYMKEAMCEIISFGFQELGLHSLEANINPANDNSRKLLLAMGFQKEAYFRENYYFDGKFLDSEIYSLLENNFNLNDLR